MNVFLFDVVTLVLFFSPDATFSREESDGILSDNLVPAVVGRSDIAPVSTGPQASQRPG
jgi:hypothetical protein